MKIINKEKVIFEIIFFIVKFDFIIDWLANSTDANHR
jgi:hypothetical protein